MIGRLHNKARKEERIERETREARKINDARTEEQKLRAEEFARGIDTPGSGYTRFECICGHKTVMHGPAAGLRFRCSQCGDAWQTVIK